MQQVLMERPNRIAAISWNHLLAVGWTDQDPATDSIRATRMRRHLQIESVVLFDDQSGALRGAMLLNAWWRFSPERERERGANARGSNSL